MAETWGMLGQSNPSATTLTDVYTVPASHRATVKVFVAERNAVASTFRVSVAVGGASDAASQYLTYNKAIGANETAEIGNITLAAGDVVRVYASTADLTFSVNGIQEPV